MADDSSSAIQPGMNDINALTEYLSIGRVLRFLKEEQGISISTESGELKLIFIRKDIVRFVINFFGETNLASSQAVIGKQEKVDFKVEESENFIVCQTSQLKIYINKVPLNIKVYDYQDREIVSDGTHGMAYSHRKEVVCFKKMDEEDFFYGFGEKSGFLNKRGEKLTMWNTDVYSPHNPETDALYQSIPFFLTMRRGNTHGIYFDNTFKTVFDLKSSQTEYSFKAEGGQLDYYLFAGPSPKEVLEQYTFLTGRMPLPPKWAIGYHQSRYSYENEKEVLALAEAFKSKGIPLDAIYLDIHYMDGYRVFTVDRQRFPHFEEMVSELKEAGIRIVPIVDPGVKEDPEYPVYSEGVKKDYFCRYLEGNIYFGEVWPGKSAFPDFASSPVREWWGEQHRFYTNTGIEGIWNDMNEPAVFNETKTMDLKVLHNQDGSPKTHREFHNLYGLMMGEATYSGMKKGLKGKRPFLLTRAGFAGVQRYSAVWTGDNRSFWEHLQMSIPMILNLGLSGVTFSGPDVGGFAHDASGELLARWTQVGAFTPYFRNHSVIGSVRQEPWSFGEKYEKIIKKYIELRYLWRPQLYTLFAEASLKGTPVMRPLFFEYPHDTNTYQISDQFMLGENVIVAPVMQPGAKHRAVYLPDGSWIDYWTDKVWEGGTYHLIQAELDILPIFIKQGSVIVLGEPKLTSEKKEKRIQLHIYFKENEKAVYQFYDDDGSSFDYESGKYILADFEITMSGENQIHINVNKKGSYKPDWREIEIAIHGISEKWNILINRKPFLAERKSNQKVIFTL